MHIKDNHVLLRQTPTTNISQEGIILPNVPALQYSGTVVALGKGITKIAVGDTVSYLNTGAGHIFNEAYEDLGVPSGELRLTHIDNIEWKGDKVIQELFGTSVLVRQEVDTKMSKGGLLIPTEKGRYFKAEVMMVAPAVTQVAVGDWVHISAPYTTDVTYYLGIRDGIYKLLIEDHIDFVYDKEVAQAVSDVAV